MVQREMRSDDETQDDTENDETRLLRPAAPSISSYSSTFEKYRKSSETLFDVRSLQNPFDDDTLETDTRFVVNAINDSHESLRKLVSK